MTAQSNFIPLEKGDYKEVEERRTYEPGLEIGGSYRLRSRWLDASQEPEPEAGFPDAGNLSFEQDLRLFLRSTVHRAAALHLEIATAQEPFNNADLRSPSASVVRERESQEVNLVARQAYLQYQANPRDRIRLGKQEISLGDRRGKVLEGLLTGISQQCAAGSFCYEVGALRLGQNTADWLYTLSVDYPVFYEVDAAGNPENVLRVEVFRVKYTERGVPLGRNNAPQRRLSNDDLDALRSDGLLTAAGSCHRDLEGYALSASCAPVYYDAVEQEYYGLRFTWNTRNWRWYSDVVGNQGRRQYYELADDNTPGERLNSKPVAGVVTEHEFSYLWDLHRVTGLFLYATGDQQREDSAQAGNSGSNYDRVLRTYYEIVPGSYRGTNFYFNGGGLDWRSGTGLGRGVGNTQLVGLRYRYTTELQSAFYEVGFYELNRPNAVLDKDGTPVSYLGLEWDNTFSWQVEDFLTWQFELNLFRRGPAFSYDDHLPPTRDSGAITHFATRLHYSF